MNSINSYTGVSPGKALFLYSIPTTLLTVALMINALTDQYFLKGFGSDTLMMGVAAVLPLMMTLQAVLGGGISNIVNTFTGKYTAEDNGPDVKRSMIHGMLILALLNLGMVGLYFLFYEDIFALLNLRPDVAAGAHDYATVVIGFSMIANMSTLFAAYMRGRVFPVAALVVLLVGIAANIVICYAGLHYFQSETLVMSGPVASSGFTLLASVFFLVRRDDFFDVVAGPVSAMRALFNQFDLKFFCRVLKQVLYVSLLPLFFTLPQFFYAGILSGASESLSGFYLIFCRALNIISLLGFGIAIAGLTLTSYYRGANMHHKIAGLVRWGTLYIGILIAGLFVQTAIDPQFFHQMMLDGTNELSGSILLLSSQLMPILKWMLPLNALGLFYSFFYIAMERPKAPVILSAVTTLVLIPVFLWTAVRFGFPFETIAWGLVGLYIVMLSLELWLLPIWHYKEGRLENRPAITVAPGGIEAA